MLPPIPKLPTDNIYKFAAIIGLIIILFSFFVRFYSQYLIQKKVFELNAEIRKNNATVDHFNNLKTEYEIKKSYSMVYLYNKLHNDTSHLKIVYENDTTKNLNKNKNNIFFLTDSVFKSFVLDLKLKDRLNEKELEIVDNIELFCDKLNDLKKNVFIDKSKTESMGSELDYYEILKERTNIILILLIILGSILLFGGITFWNKYNQIYQDKIIILQFHELKTKLENEGTNVKRILSDYDKEWSIYKKLKNKIKKIKKRPKTDDNNNIST
ncbi:MAG: hypothetical protein NTU73_14685 [Ignavibacteriae bacterium]|nr:hypothetical protein [Ignavibacteriota bacterium]